LLSMSAEKYLVFGGKTGWIGIQLVEMLKAQGKDVTAAASRIENLSAISEELDSVKPTHLLMSAGLTGRPNVDWCEFNKEETLKVNVAGTLLIADQCNKRGIHCTIFGTGCIYEYDADHPIGGKGFLENEPPNFDKSFYSKTKGMVQELLTSYPHVLLLRIRMPISDDLSPRNFVTKIARYNKVVDVPNSMSVLRELLPLSLAMALAKDTGVFNLTNPGAISHNEVLTLYKAHVDPSFEWTNFSLEEQSKVITAGRSNNTLDTAKLEAAAARLGKPLSGIKEAVEETMKRIRARLEADGAYPSGLPTKLP